MIPALNFENYKNITRISILNSRSIFYPIKFVLESRDIAFDENDALTVNPIFDDLKYPATVKLGDAGQLWEYVVQFSINNQSLITRTELQKLINQKVIIVLHHPEGRFIIGCNEFPLTFLFGDDNTTNPASSNGYSIECRGFSYISKVIV